MRQDAAAELHRSIKHAGIDFISYLPDGLIEDLQRSFKEDPDTICVPVNNENEAVAVCAGAWLGGRRPGLIISDSGLLVAAWAVAALAVTYGIPMVLVIAHRGHVGDRSNWRFLTYNFTTEPLLATLQVPAISAGTLDEATDALADAALSAAQWQHPVAVLLHGSVLAH